jgi:hypothetical protein
MQHNKNIHFKEAKKLQKSQLVIVGTERRKEEKDNRALGDVILVTFHISLVEIKEIVKNMKLFLPLNMMYIVDEVVIVIIILGIKYFVK